MFAGFGQAEACTSSMNTLTVGSLFKFDQPGKRGLCPAQRGSGSHTGKQARRLKFFAASCAYFKKAPLIRRHVTG
ncbi:hypothetical protein AL066_29030 [Pseudomonas nunensis]|nr:hypothetical protein AL066_29030 [Pseudomonas nunensis]